MSDDFATSYARAQTHFARYFDALDRGDLDAVMAILEGATVVAGGRSVTDPAVIRAVYAARHTTPARDGARPTKHVVSNVLLTGPDDAGRYEASAYYARLEPGDSGPVVALSGRIVTVLTPAGERWQVVRHEVIHDF